MSTQTSEAHKLNAEYDGLIFISMGKSRRSKTWKAKIVSWSGLMHELSKTHRTTERHADYLMMPKEDQDQIKDVGGFVGGTVNGGRRTASSMGTRQLITLDADFAEQDFWQTVRESFKGACCIYTTHKHSPENPRYRLVVPLSRAVTPDEYQAISRMLASDIGIDFFDDTTYQPHRLMYYPSTSADGEFKFEWQDAQWLSADDMLNRYEDWKDQSSWPVSSRQATILQHEAKKQQSPLEKKGIVGAFCRAYSIPEAIAAFLPDVYTECTAEGRYTFSMGSTTGGAVLYDDGLFLYSHHATDPCSMQLVNAFDMVRLHKFGAQDEGKSTKDVTKLPSYKAMLEFASGDAEVRVLMQRERMAEVQQDFMPIAADGDGDSDAGQDSSNTADDLEWAKMLKVHEKTGIPYPTRYNIRIILENDPAIKGTFAWDSFAHRIAMVGRPAWRSEADMREDRFWTDADETNLMGTAAFILFLAAP